MVDHDQATTDHHRHPDRTDVDLDDVRLADGTRLTRARAEAIIRQTRHPGGRPSLSGGPARSPQIAFRVSAEVRDRAAQKAAQEGKTISQLAREALEARLAAKP